MFFVSWCAPRPVLQHLHPYLLIPELNEAPELALCLTSYPTPPSYSLTPLSISSLYLYLPFWLVTVPTPYLPYFSPSTLPLIMGGPHGEWTGAQGSQQTWLSSLYGSHTVSKHKHSKPPSKGMRTSHHLLSALDTWLRWLWRDIYLIPYSQTALHCPLFSVSPIPRIELFLFSDIIPQSVF